MQAMQDSKYNRTRGFTLVEMLVIVPVLMLAIAVVLSALITLMQHNATAKASLNITYDNQRALDIMENDVNLSSRYLVTPDPSPTVDPYGSDNTGTTWSYKNYDENHRVLLLRTYSSTENPLSDTRGVVYEDEEGCGATLYENPSFLHNVVYFVRNGNLYKRILTDTQTPRCNNQYQQQSCPVDVSYPRNALCKADDEIILENVTAMQIQYYAAPTDTVPIDAFGSSDPEVLNIAQSIEITLTSSTTAGGEPITNTMSLRVSRLNT